MKDGQASSTAKVIAASTLLLAGDARTAGLVAPGAAELSRVLLSSSAGDRLLAQSARWRPTRAFWRGLERLTLPGITAHYWHRKRRIEAWCRAGLAEGFERLVIVGAGLDTLGCRLAREHAGLQVVEVDHPDTQARKHRALEAGRIALPPNLRFAPCDLAVQHLPLHELGAGRATLVLIEGVLMYLSLPDVDRVFQALHTCRARPLRILFSAMERWADGSTGFRPRSWCVERWLAVRGEPLRWSIAPGELQAFLEVRGFRLTQLVQSRELHQGAQAPVDLEGEDLVACEPLRAQPPSASWRLSAGTGPPPPCVPPACG